MPSLNIHQIICWKYHKSSQRIKSTFQVKCSIFLIKYFLYEDSISPFNQYVVPRRLTILLYSLMFVFAFGNNKFVFTSTIQNGLSTQDQLKLKEFLVIWIFLVVGWIWYQLLIYGWLGLSRNGLEWFEIDQQWTGLRLELDKFFW